MKTLEELVNLYVDNHKSNGKKLGPNPTCRFFTKKPLKIILFHLFSTILKYILNIYI
jgi:hypothetical protein